MATATLTIGPANTGQGMSWEEFKSSQFEEGFRYELIDGRLVVTPAPNPYHDVVSDMINFALVDYRRKHPEIINYTSSAARVFIPGRPDVTTPEPDMVAYCDFPKEEAVDENFDWSQVAPILIVEIVSSDMPDKDLIRNVELYQAVLSVREYWIFDPRGGADKTTMTVYRRRGKHWQKPIQVANGATYATKMLPGFSLKVDPLA